MTNFTPSINYCRLRHWYRLSLCWTTGRKAATAVVSVMRIDSCLAPAFQPHWSHGREEWWSPKGGDGSVHVPILLRSILIWLCIDNISPRSLSSTTTVHVGVQNRVNTFLQQLSSIHHSAKGTYYWRHIWMIFWLLCVYVELQQSLVGEGLINRCIDNYSEQTAEKWIIWFNYVWLGGRRYQSANTTSMLNAC